MRSCTPGNERAFSLNTVPRIRKSFAWLYFFLFGSFDVAAGVCAAGAEEGGDDAGSCVEAIATAREAKSAAVHGTVIHRRRCIGLLLIDLDGGKLTGGCQEERGVCLLFLVCFFVFLVILVDKVAIFAGLFFFFFLVLLFVQIIGDEVQVDGMRLRNLDFVFIDVDFGGTFGATNHGSILRTFVRKWGCKDRARHPAAYYIPRWTKSTPVHAGAALNGTAP